MYYFILISLGCYFLFSRIGGFLGSSGQRRYKSTADMYNQVGGTNFQKITAQIRLIGGSLVVGGLISLFLL